jgi:hypothetical protein
MVMIGRFSSDDPAWREPWDRETEPANDDGDWAALDPRPRRVPERRANERQRDTRSRSKSESDPKKLDAARRESSANSPSRNDAPPPDA